MRYIKQTIKKPLSRMFQAELLALESLKVQLNDLERIVQTQAEFSGHYNYWRDKRVTAIISHFSPLWFKGKKILELGCGFGDIGAVFAALGAEVTCSEARQEHVDELKKRYSHMKAIKANMENEWPFEEQYDLILHLGLLYHLDNVHFSLEKSLAHSKYLVLETEVCDSDDPAKILKVNEDAGGYDQSFVGRGSRPSAEYIEAILQEHNASFKRVDDARANAIFHTYDWPVKNSNDWCHGLRRFWFVEQDDV